MCLQGSCLLITEKHKEHNTRLLTCRISLIVRQDNNSRTSLIWIVKHQHQATLIMPQYVFPRPWPRILSWVQTQLLLKSSEKVMMLKTKSMIYCFNTGAQTNGTLTRVSNLWKSQNHGILIWLWIPRHVNLSMGQFQMNLKLNLRNYCIKTSKHCMTASFGIV